MSAPDDSTYTETLPPAPLAPLVSAVWSHARRAAPRSDGPPRILPDGSADVVLGFVPVGPSPAGPLALAEIWVVGTMTTAHVVDAAAPDAHVGVRLRPAAAGRVLGVPAQALLDDRLPLAALWPEAEPLLASPPAEVARGVRLFEASGGRARVAEVSRALGVSRQHLARQFARHVGLAPKTFARVARLRALDAGVRALERRGRVCWGALAYAHGYADQAHLVEDVRALTGLTPMAWLRERRPAERPTAVPFAQDAAAAGA